MKQLTTKILENKRIAPDFCRMKLESSYLARNAKPGQFVEVKCSDKTDVLLRRPLGVHRITKSGIELLYEVVGKGTEKLSKRKAGDTLDIIGPLGSGFELSPNSKLQTPILIAGGVGVAPLLALAEKLAYSVERIAYIKNSRIDVFIGAKTKSHILCEKEFKKLGANLYITTEDGSKGEKGLITELFFEHLSAKRYTLNATIYACGPAPMLKAVARIAEKNNIPCQVSLEERMACGVGVCLGCPVRVKTNDERRTTNDEYKMVCKDGPVFNAKEIKW